MHCFVDIETIGHDCATEFIPKPDLDAITPAKNLKDPAKIAENIAARKAEATAEYDTALSRAALDWNVSRIVAIGFQTEAMAEPYVLPCRNEGEEAAALSAFWAEAKGRRLVGFNARGFDVPTLIQRSRLLNVSHPRLRLDRFGRGDVVDIRDILTFDDARYEALMPRSLKAFAQRFGIPVADETDGSDVAALVAAGNMEAVIAHCTSDVTLTRQLAKRVNALPTWREAQSGYHEDEHATVVAS